MLLTDMSALIFCLWDRRRVMHWICVALKSKSTEIVNFGVNILKFRIKYSSDCDLIWLVETDLKSLVPRNSNNGSLSHTDQIRNKWTINPLNRHTAVKEWTSYKENNSVQCFSKRHFWLIFLGKFLESLVSVFYHQTPGEKWAVQKVVGYL